MPQDLETQVKNLIASGASDDDISFYISEHKKRNPEPTTLDNAKSIGRGALKGLGDLVSFDTIKQGVEAVPDIVRNLKSGTQSVWETDRALREGSREAANQMVRLPKALYDAYQRGELLKTIDPAKGTEDPYEANARRVTNVAGLLAGPKTANKLTGLFKAGEAASDVSALGRMGVPFSQEGSMAMKTAPEIASADAQIARSLPNQQKMQEAAEAYTKLTPHDAPLKALDPAGSVPPMGARQPQFPAPPKRLPAMPDRPHQPTGLNRTANDLKYRAEQRRLDKAEAAANPTVSAAPQTPPPTGGAPAREGHFKLPKVKDPANALAAAENNATLKSRGMMPQPVPEEVHLQSAARAAERRATAGTSPTGVERRTPPADKIAQLEADPANPAYAKSPFKVADEETLKRLQADYSQPSLEDVNLEDLIATQGTITRDVAAGKLGQQAERLEQLPVGAQGRPPVGSIPVIIRGADGKLYIGDGTHSLSASWAEGVPTRQAVVYPEKAAAQAPPLGAAKNAPAAAMAEGKGSATMTLQEMRDYYGSKKAAARAGMTEDELRAQTSASKRFPKEAEEMAEDQAYRNRIADDGPYLYAGIDPRAIFNVAKKYPKLFGAAGGAAIGSQVDEKDPLGGAMVGGAGGALFGRIVQNSLGPNMSVRSRVGNALENANDLRVESMLSGSAIPKNIAAAAGNPITAALENIGAPAKLASNPVKEILRLPTNVKNFKQALMNPTMTTTAASHAKVKGPMGRTIGAVDQTFVDAMKRSGLNQNEIERLALTADNPMFNQIGQTAGGRFLFPFQRTPANMMTEGIGEGNAMLRGTDTRVGRQPADLPHVNSSMRRAMSAATVTGGTLAGSAVAGSKNKKRNATLLGIALAALGPRAMLGTMGAAAGGAGRMGIGSISPVQEFAFEPPSIQSPLNWTGMPPAFFKFMENLKGKK